MNAKRILRALCLPLLLASCANPMPGDGQTSMAETSLFKCEGFTKHADGSWWAGPNTLPFNVGSYRDVVVQNSGPINRDFGVFPTGENLYDVLEQHCGGVTAPEQ